jgi:cytidylate kinase
MDDQVPTPTGSGRATVPRDSVVTISASYGAGGSLIAPKLAQRLQLPFIDRMISADISDAAAGPAAAGRGDSQSGPDATRSGEGLSGGEQAASPGSRLFSYLARGASVGTITAPPMDVDTDEDLRRRAEWGLAAIRDGGGGGVILGRAGAVVLARRPRTFHVRLDGPAARRIVVAARLEGVTQERAAEREARTDRARELWVKRLYRADATDPKWYHLWLDTTVLTADDVLDIIEKAFSCYLVAMAPRGDPTGGC